MQPIPVAMKLLLQLAIFLMKNNYMKKICSHGAAAKRPNGISGELLMRS
jgi:hypothetical protein